MSVFDICSECNKLQNVECECKPLTSQTFTLIGTKEELEQWAADMAKCGWKLTYNGHSGSWLGEPIYKVRKELK